MIKIKLCAFSDESSNSLDGQVDALTRNGIRLMEIRNVDGKNVAELTINDAKKIAEKLSQANIKMWSLGSPIGKSSLQLPKEYEEERLRHLIEIAKVFNCKNMRIFSYFAKNHTDDRAEILLRLKRLVKIAKSEGITLLHENEKDIYGDSALRALDVLNNVKGLKQIYDPANFIQCNQDIDFCLNELAISAKYFHIKDVIASSGTLVPAGGGDGKIMQLVNSIKKDTVLTVEPHLAIFEGYDKIDNLQLNNKTVFSSQQVAFDTAVKAIKQILSLNGYAEEDSVWKK